MSSIQSTLHSQELPFALIAVVVFMKKCRKSHWIVVFTLCIYFSACSSRQIAIASFFLLIFCCLFLLLLVLLITMRVTREPITNYKRNYTYSLVICVNSVQSIDKFFPSLIFSSFFVLFFRSVHR